MAESQVVQKESIGSRVLGTVVNVVLIVAIVFAFFCTYTAYVTKNGSGVPDILGYEPFSIQTDSMSPFFEAGDLIIDKRVKDLDALKVGDVITFWTIIEGEKVLNTHRIVSVEDGGNFTYFVTKGDNNTIEDAMTVHQSEVVGIYHTKIENMGTVLDFLQTSKGFFCIVVLPVFAFFLYYLVTFFKVLFEYQAVKNREKFEQEQEEKQRQQAQESDEVLHNAAGNGEVTLTQEQLRALLEKAGVAMPDQTANVDENN